MIETLIGIGIGNDFLISTSESTQVKVHFVSFNQPIKIKLYSAATRITNEC